MKKIIPLLSSLLFVTLSFSQGTPEETEINLLTAPASPASSLLGFATSDIEKPSEVTDFMISLQTASSSFTKLPASYAVDFAPFLAFRKNVGDITLDGLNQNRNVFAQTLVLSMAIKNTDSLEALLNKESVYGGFGFKFSIVRGKYDQATTNKLDSIELLQRRKLNLLSDISDRVNANPIVINLENQRNELISLYGQEDVRVIKANTDLNLTVAELTVIYEATVSAERTEIENMIQEIASTIQITRKGLSWDVNGGISTEFVDKNFNKSRVNNDGLWTTFGYTSENYGAFLGILRYLYNPDKIYANDDAENIIDNVSTMDAGIRYVYGKSQSKFNLSLEAIYRSVFEISEIEPSWRLVFNAEYSLFKNQKLTFSFGRNFDGTTTKDGNLIAALSFIKGFGSKRIL